MDNILSSKYELDDYSVGKLSDVIRDRVKARRLEMNLTQAALAKKSGVSLGTLKHFERYAKISLQHLLMLAVILQATDEFKKLFTNKLYQSIDDVIENSKPKKRQRGRINV